MAVLVAGVGVLVCGTGLLLVAFAILDLRDEVCRFKQDLMVMMKRNTPGTKEADVGAYMKRELERQGRLK